MQNWNIFVGVTALCPWARHISLSLVLVQHRKTHPYITERLLMGCKESIKQTKSIPTSPVIDLICIWKSVWLFTQSHQPLVSDGILMTFCNWITCFLFVIHWNQKNEWSFQSSSKPTDIDVNWFPINAFNVWTTPIVFLSNLYFINVFSPLNTMPAGDITKPLYRIPLHNRRDYMDGSRGGDRGSRHHHPQENLKWL